MPMNTAFFEPVNIAVQRPVQPHLRRHPLLREDGSKNWAAGRITRGPLMKKL